MKNPCRFVLIQEIVGWAERGSVTASYLFARSVGSTFGATVFGAVLNAGLLRAWPRRSAPISFAACSKAAPRRATRRCAGRLRICCTLPSSRWSWWRRSLP